MRCLEPHAGGITGPALLDLNRCPYGFAGEGQCEIGLDFFAPMTHDDYDVRTPCVEGRAYRVVYDRQATHAVHDFRDCAHHARPLPSGKNDGGCGLHEPLSCTSQDCLRPNAAHSSPSSRGLDGIRRRILIPWQGIAPRVRAPHRGTATNPSMKSCPRCSSRYPADVRYCFVDGAELTETRDPLMGAMFAGRYIIEGVIGEGGMATVYRARQTLHDWPCAVKILKPALASNPTVRERFRREAKSAQMIAHPNVIEIFDQGETAGSVPYIVMELLDGETLASLLRRGHFALSRAIPILIQVARGIARAHDLGVVHRDLKPDNVVICSRPDGSDLAKILDFGIARTRTDTHLTHSGELFGTPQYMAPERMTRNESGPSVDLYALGVVLYEVTTGRLPFNSADPTTLLIMHMTEKAPTPRSIDPALPEELDALIVKLLEKEPRARPVDAHRIEQDLVAVARRLRCAVPPDPEDEVSASRRSQAGAVLDDITTEWTRRVEVFERMLAHPATGEARRKDLAPTLTDVRTLVRRLAGIRSSTRTEQRALERLDERGRDSRQRFGAAVDALGVDASKAKEEIRVAQAHGDASALQAKQAAERYAEAAQDVILWEGRSGYQEPHPALAQAHRACAGAVDLWSAARQAEVDARAALSERERTGDDLSYQIGVLRAALADDEQIIERERRFVRERLAALDDQADRIELDVLELATRFCEPLRILPELGPLFRQLESEATVPA